MGRARELYEQPVWHLVVEAAPQVVVFGMAMSALALIGGVTTLLSERALAPPCEPEV